MQKYFSLCCEAVPFLICLVQFRKFNITRYKFFLLFLPVIMLYEIGNAAHLFTHNHSNLGGVNIETVIEYIFYSYFIISAFRKKSEQKLFFGISAVCLVFTIVDIVFIQGIFKLCSYAIVVQYALLIVLVCRFFYRKMNEFDRETSLLHQPDFWVNTGLLFYFLCQFLFFASFNLAYNSKHAMAFALLFHVTSGVSNIILYSCLSISFLCFRQIKTASL